MNEVPNLSLEIGSISDRDIRLLTEEVLRKVPPYFWTLPASSSGKYHPPRERAAYGLVYHTKEVARISCLVWESYVGTSLNEVRSAALLHDVGRYGLAREHSPHSLVKHPDIAADLILEVATTLGLKPDGFASRISYAVRSHMGRWGKVKPLSDLDWIVHLADNIASKNW